jgi:hypothetical protein
MRSRKFRWSDTSKQVAGVCVGLAMFEIGNPEAFWVVSVRHAFSLSLGTDGLTRSQRILGTSLRKTLLTLKAVAKILDIKLPLSEPSFVLSILLAHVQVLFDHPSSAGAIVSSLLSKPSFSFDSIVTTAKEISTFLSRFTAFSDVGPGPTASACIILSFETALQAAFHMTVVRELAAVLSADLEQTDWAVVERHTAMLAIFEDWMKDLPWIKPWVSNEGKWDMSRRDGVVRGVRDALDFQDELIEERGLVHRPAGAGQREDTEMADQPRYFDQVVGPSRLFIPRKKHLRLVEHMAQLLLDPSYGAKAPNFPTRNYPVDMESYLGRTGRQLLAGEDRTAPVGRLGELLLERGSEALIADEELFDPGEWEETFNDGGFAGQLGKMHPEWDLPPRAPPIAESASNVGALKKKGGVKGKKLKRSKAQEVLERVQALQEEEVKESGTDKDPDEQWAMEMWTEFDVEDEGMIGFYNTFGADG